VSRPVNFEQLLQYATLKRSDLAPRAARRSSRRSNNSPPDPASPGSAVASPATVAEAQRRFAICKTCPHSCDDGFACELYDGCCFGRFRSAAANHCPFGLW